MFLSPLQLDHESVSSQLAALPEGSKWFWRLSGGGREMLLVYQSAFQRRMLVLYGNSLVCLDATYKTTKYNYPLFIIVVIDNHGHGIPVAWGVMQSESSIMIAEFLQM